MGVASYEQGGAIVPLEKYDLGFFVSGSPYKIYMASPWKKSDDAHVHMFLVTT